MKKSTKGYSSLGRRSGGMDFETQGAPQRARHAHKALIALLGNTWLKASNERCVEPGLEKSSCFRGGEVYR